uniref:Uncharacterized protein n=1 Tax=Anopheles maculatus TaxID=74869 RepID=A0A182T8L1_9DIPT
MDYIGDLLNQMSSAFNQETAIPKKEEISMDETLKWRALKNNQFASRTRFPHQIASSTGSGSTRSGLINGRKSAGGGGTTSSGSTSNRQRRQTSGGSCTDSRRPAATVDDGSRSPAALLGDNGTLTPDPVADEEQEVSEEEGEDIEIEIAKDISGEELQEALGLSQLVEVESEDFGTTLEMEERMETAETSDDLALQEEKKRNPTMEEQNIGGEAEIVAEDCKPEDVIDTKASLEVPYCSSASVSPTVLLEQKEIVNEQLVLLPSKCDTEEVDVPMQIDDTHETKTPNSMEHEGAAADSTHSGDGAVECKTSSESNEQMITIDHASKTIGEIDTVAKVGDKDVHDDAATADLDDAPMLDNVEDDDDDDEDDVLIINTDEVDEVVELAETSKEDEEDEEESSKNDDLATTMMPQPKDDAQSIAEIVIEKQEASEPQSDALVTLQNVADKVEEKFDPKEKAVEEKQVVAQARDQSSNDCEEVKFSDSLKASTSNTQLKQSGDPQSSVCEKVEEKTESTMVEECKSSANETDERSEKETANVSMEKSEQTAAAGRTTRSKKVTTVAVAPAVNTSPPAGIAAITQSQRRSQRFQKDSTSVASGEGKLNGENATEPMLIVKEEEPDDTVAPKKRASVGAGSAGEAKMKASIKSDRSLRSKQQGSSAATQPPSSSVTTRRASETVKATPDEAHDTPEGNETEKSMTGRRGRKRLSQDRSAASSVVSNDPVTRTREKSTKSDEVPKVVESTVVGQGR